MFWILYVYGKGSQYSLIRTGWSTATDWKATSFLRSRPRDALVYTYTEKWED
jgi:hypothetical protein